MPLNQYRTLTPLHHIAMSILTGCLVVACSTPLHQAGMESKSFPGATSTNPDALIVQAGQSKMPQQANQLYLQATEAYLHNKQFDQAFASLANFDPRTSNAGDIPRFYLVRLKLAIELEDRALLSQLESEQAFTILLSQRSSIAQMSETARLVATANTLLNKPLSTALVLAENFGLFAAAEQPLLTEEIWQNLRLVPLSDLAQADYVGKDPHVHAWLELAKEIQLNQGNLEHQFQALKSWKLRWPEHPASNILPSELAVLQTLPESRPAHIVLALPLSGQLAQVGTAIRNGLLAAMYANPLSYGSSFEFYDTAKHTMEDLYTKLSIDNTLVIGPLDKTSINRITQFDHIPVKTLALNYTSGDDDKLPANLLQFGLSPEQEAVQVAQRLGQKRFNRVVVIAPQNELGLRIHDAFVSEFTQQSGTILKSVFFTKQEDLAIAVADALGTADSQKRSSRLQEVTKLPLHFDPRRRRDLDAIFLIATPEQAKQLNPLLAYNFASDVPTFATSLIHDPKSQENTDLNNIQFIQMPWLLDNSNALKATLASSLPAESEHYSQFHALGVDAMELAPRLPLLEKITYSQIEGQTGKLSLHNGKIQRLMQWATFKNGKVVAITD